MARAAAKSTARKKPAAKKPAAPKAPSAPAQVIAPPDAADLTAAITGAIEAGARCASCPFWKMRGPGAISGALCFRFPQKIIKGADEVCGEHPELKFPPTNSPAGTVGASSGTEA